MSNDSPIRYLEEIDGVEKVIYRASAIGGCVRAFVACARGVAKQDPPEKFATIFEEGHIAEPQILSMWEEHGGAPARDSQHEIDWEVVDGIIIRGHVDGLYTEDDGNTGIYECKKFRESTVDAWIKKGVEVHETYPWQVSALMHGWNQREDYYPMVTMLGGQWDGEKIVDLFPQYLAMPPIPARAFKKKVAQIERLIAEDYDPTDPDVPCTESYPCGYWKIHPSTLAGGKKESAGVSVSVPARKVPEEIEKALMNDISWTSRIKGINDDLTKIEAARREGRKVIAAWMADNGVKEGMAGTLATPDYEMTRTVVGPAEVKAYTRAGYEKFAVKFVEKAKKKDKHETVEEATQ